MSAANALHAAGTPPLAAPASLAVPPGSWQLATGNSNHD